MGLDFLAMVLDHHPDVRASSSSSRVWGGPSVSCPQCDARTHARSDEQGALLVEEEDGLETLENLQYNQNEVIASKATQLVRKYYGDVRSSSSRVRWHCVCTPPDPNRRTHTRGCLRQHRKARAELGGQCTPRRRACCASSVSFAAAKRGVRSF
jgi:hypothetical protein